MLKRVVITMASMLTLAYLAWAIYYFTNPETGGRTGRCTGVEIKILEDGQKGLMSESDVRAELAKMKFAPEGKALDSIDILQLQNTLRNNKTFRSADVYLTPVGKVHVTLSLYEPLLLIMTSKDRYYISTERGVMPYYPSALDSHLVATGAIDTVMAMGKLYDLARVIKDSEYWDALVTQVYVRTDSSIMIVPRVGNTDIVLGKTPDWTQKLDKLKIFIDHVIARTGWDAFSMLNVSYKDQVVARPTEEFAALQNNKTTEKP